MGVIDLKPEDFSNNEKWKKICDALVGILETQQSQLETLADERKRQEERIKVKYESWISGIRSLKDVIDQLRREKKLSEMARLVEAAKTNLVFGLKMKQELVYNLKLESSEDDLTDFVEWFDILCDRCPKEKDVSPDMQHDMIEERAGEAGSSMADRRKKVDSRALQKEVKRLKGEYEKLSIKYSSEVSALSAEKEFAWNQYREMESRFATQLQEKNDEVIQVNDRVTELLETVDRLQSSNREKDAQIADLKANLTKMEAAAATRKDGEAEELKILKKSKGDLLTPVLRRCSTEPKAKALSCDGKHGVSKRTPPVSRFCTTEAKGKKNKALKSDDENGTASRSMKRKSSSTQEVRSQGIKRVAFKEETPKLFTSDFKIPKLKITSLR